MTTTAFLLSLALRLQAVDKPTLQYYQEAFDIRSKAGEVKVPLKPPKVLPAPFVAFRRDQTFAVWDERGLTIRHGSKVLSSRLPDIPTSPRIFAREEILRNVDRIRSGASRKEATSLSGAKRLGKYAYFLVRWDDKAGKPWIEALLQVDLTSAKLKPDLLGRFEGLSTASGAIDDRLQIIQGKLAIIERSGDSWGVSTFDPKTQLFVNQPMGGTLIAIDPINALQGLFIEKSAYGTSIAGRVDLITGTRRILYEGRERLKFIDTESPEVVLATSAEKTKLVNCVTGAVRSIPYVVDARRVDSNVLLWTAPDNPSAAWLMSPKIWETLTTWREH